MAQGEDTIRELVKRLRESMPPLLPVRFYLRAKVGDGWLGATALHYRCGAPSHFVIVVRRSHYLVMRDTLIHEWAHAIAWHQGHETVDDHDPEWALAYSRVYQELTP